MKENKKNILVIFDNNKKEYTYENRAKELVKSNRAIVIDTNTIKMKGLDDQEHIKYWVSQWCIYRRYTMIKYNDAFKVNKAYLNDMTMEEFHYYFNDLFQLFSDIYLDMALNPIRWGLPTYEINNYRFYSSQERSGRIDSFRALKLLFILCNSSSITNNTLVIDIKEFTKINDIKNYHKILESLTDYGFEFTNLKNYKVNSDDFTIEHPEFNMIKILKMMANKALNINDIDSFYRCSYYFFEDEYNNKTTIQKIMDLVNEEEKVFLQQFNGIMEDLGYLSYEIVGYEGPSIAYIKNKSAVYKVRITTIGDNIFKTVREKDNMLLMLRLRNINNCLEYISKAPKSIKAIFSEVSDVGCGRKQKSCNKGIEYVYNDITYWKCGCYRPPFIFKPKIEDIKHYLKLIELGTK